MELFKQQQLLFRREKDSEWTGASSLLEAAERVERSANKKRARSAPKEPAAKKTRGKPGVQQSAVNAGVFEEEEEGEQDEQDQEQEQGQNSTAPAGSCSQCNVSLTEENVMECIAYQLGSEQDHVQDVCVDCGSAGGDNALQFCSNCRDRFAGKEMVLLSPDRQKYLRAVALMPATGDCNPISTFAILSAEDGSHRVVLHSGGGLEAMVDRTSAKKWKASAKVQDSAGQLRSFQQWEKEEAGDRSSMASTGIPTTDFTWFFKE